VPFAICDLPFLPPPPRSPENFSLADRPPRITREQVIERLQAFAHSRGTPAPFTHQQFNAWPHHRFRACTAVKRFGSWRAALDAAGIHGAKRRKIPRDQLMLILDATWRKLGHYPSDRDLIRHADITINPYRRHWGTLKNACTQLARYHNSEVSWEDLTGPNPSPKRPGLPPALRWQILARDHHRCTACGDSPATTPDTRLHVDHILPVSRGGSDHPSNLRTLCQTCNLGRGNAQAEFEPAA
jgi:hypothetical protein